jgi:putative N6-adenine-specific DNA methylase
MTMGEFVYLKTRRFFAQTPQGCEELAVKELADLGAESIAPAVRGLYFCADRSVLYKINYQARLISRVMAPLLTFACRNRNDLYQAGLSIDWGSIFSVKNTFAIFSNVSGNGQITHSQFASQCLKDAVADHFRTRSNRRPDVDLVHPDIWINLFIEKNHGTISLDTSGGSLHRRGYRQKSVEAPMQEILAAAMVDLSGWKGECPVYDPMCGSGTLLCEALIKYCRIPAGFLRKAFGFFFMPDFSKDIWEKIKTDAGQRIRELPFGLISGSDADPAAYRAALENISVLPQGQGIKLSRKAYNDIAGLENQAILCNPPYGIRMKTGPRLEDFYKDFGDFLKHRCKGSQATLFFGNRDMIKCIGLKPAWKKPMKNAGLDGRVVRYDLY